MAAQGISCELALRWVSLYLTDDKSTLVQVMAWCRQATSHYLSQCQGRQFQTRGGIYHGINRYKLSCHKQVSDTQNVQNCHKRVLNNKIVWNCVSNILQYIIYVNKMLKKTFLSLFTSLKSLYCIIIIITVISSYLCVITIIVLNCLKLSKTGSIHQFMT